MLLLNNTLCFLTMAKVQSITDKEIFPYIFFEGTLLNIA